MIAPSWSPQEGFFAGLVDVVVENFGDTYAELGEQACQLEIVPASCSTWAVGAAQPRPRDVCFMIWPVFAPLFGLLH